MNTESCFDHGICEGSYQLSFGYTGKFRRNKQQRKTERELKSYKTDTKLVSTATNTQDITEEVSDGRGVS